ncbi:immediate early response gene 2 protein [Cololabis saira]|uniref:immediate early response gene 2 protein n=1 Tax=Cololabis saira TaxID=129043 RepID=UPI002AD33B24|nr:immediate early response gene 2 protein [Cololabis saira]
MLQTTCDMEVSAEAKRIMVVALGKLYSSRTQRGGVRLHRSLLLSLVMKSARDIYHAAQPAEDSVAADQPQCTVEETEYTEPGGARDPGGPAAAPGGPSTLNTRKRRGKAAAEPDFLPCKKAKLEHGLYSCSVLVDYVKCSSNLGPSSSPIHLHTAIAAC